MTFKKAIGFYKNGKYHEAAALCKAVIEKQPKHFDALHLLGFLYYQRDQAVEALALLNLASELQPSHLGVQSGICLCYMRLGRFHDALSGYDKALSFKPDHIEILNGRGNALMALKRFDDAIESFERALSFKPDFIEALNNLGNAQIELGYFEAAVKNFDEALKIEPQLPEALNNRGNALRNLMRFGEAMASYQAAIGYRPNYAEAWNNCGNLFNQLNRPTEALSCYDKALYISPNYADALFNRGNILMDLGCPKEALDNYDQAISVNPTDSYIKNNRGNALKELGLQDEALLSYESALMLNPIYDDAYNNKGTVLNELGRFEEASKAIETAIKLSPRKAIFYFNLTISKRFTINNPYLHAMEEMLNDRDSLSIEDQIHLEFALSKALADIGDYNRSFPHLIDGNALKRGKINYDESSTLKILSRSEAAFSKALMRKKEGQGDPSAIPIFIIGMPRSGTSLVEQILASHPKVHGAGEINDLVELINTHGGAKAASSPERLSDMTIEELHDLGTNYVRRMQGLGPGAIRVIDKTPGNFHLVGIIHLALPNARIIHTRRNAVDTCVSCFSNLFLGNNLPYTYDLKELGRFYLAYETMMEHWRKLLPKEVFLDLQYEDVVIDLEGQARRILAHCGLEWDPRCLEFYKTKRPVRTASKVQVRQPIYKSSVGRWHAYESFLKPLLEILDRAPLDNGATDSFDDGERRLG